MAKKRPLRSVERAIQKNFWTGPIVYAQIMASRIAKLDPLEAERVILQNPGVAKFVDRKVFAGDIEMNLMEAGLKITNTKTGDSISLTEEDLT